MDDLIASARAGDQTALVMLLQTRNDKLYRTAYLYLHNQQDALDAVQETALQVMLSIHKLKQPEYFDTWLIRVELNCIFKMMRSRQPTLTDLAVDEPSVASDLHADLQSDLEKLPKNLQVVIVMRYYNDLPLAQIAKVLHLPLGTVKSRLNRGLARMRQEGAVRDAYRI
jgi:RNA polymerase sigma-70 factor (ECF subfamily)